MESLFCDVDVDGYYKPIIVKNAFKEDEEDGSGYKLHKSRGDKDKISSR